VSVKIFFVLLNMYHTASELVFLIQKLVFVMSG